MKIAYITYPSFVDCDLPLIRSLREAGHDVRYYLVLTPYHCHSTLVDIKHLSPEYRILNGNAYPELLPYDRYIDLSTLRIVNFGGNNKFRILFLWEKLRKDIKRFSPDIVHFTQFLPPYGFPLYYSFRGKLVATVHDPIPHLGEEYWWNEKLRRVGLKHVSSLCFLSNNETQNKAFLNRYGVPERIIHYAGLAPYDIYRVVQRNDTKYESDFLFIGRISPYKGIDILLQAKDILREKGIHCKLIVAGAGQLPENSKFYAQRDDIEIINRYISVSELIAMIDDTNYVVCPYKEATQSGVIMTALALGRPVIATRVGDFESVITNNVNGFLTEANNPEALAEVMEKSLEPSNIMQITAALSRQSALTAWQDIAQQYVAIYNLTIRNRKRK